MEDCNVIAHRVRDETRSTHVACGCAARAKNGWAIETGGDRETLFDLASVTKPMTAVAVAAIAGLRADPLEKWLPEVAGTASARVPLELLLAHRAGLDAHRPLYAPLVHGRGVDRTAALREAADARRGDAQGVPPPEGFAPLYSDLGYLLAGEALARAAGAIDAGEAIERLVVWPLGLGEPLGTARALGPCAAEAAPTEDVPWRGGVVRGAVHDENAWSISGMGGSGHAGMFGTVGAVIGFGIAVLDALAGRGGPFGAIDLAWTVRERPGGTLRAGFDGKSPEGSSAGARIGPRAFGHLGFTGTSLWIDPDAETIVSLLTNRVHPTRENATLRAARPRAHDALFARALALRAAG